MYFKKKGGSLFGRRDETTAGSQKKLLKTGTNRSVLNSVGHGGGYPKNPGGRKKKMKGTKRTRGGRRNGEIKHNTASDGPTEKKNSK